MARVNVTHEDSMLAGSHHMSKEPCSHDPNQHRQDSTEFLYHQYQVLTPIMNMQDQTSSGTSQTGLVHDLPRSAPLPNVRPLIARTPKIDRVSPAFLRSPSDSRSSPHPFVQQIQPPLEMRPDVSMRYAPLGSVPEHYHHGSYSGTVQPHPHDLAQLSPMSNAFPDSANMDPHSYRRLGNDSRMQRTTGYGRRSRDSSYSNEYRKPSARSSQEPYFSSDLAREMYSRQPSFDRSSSFERDSYLPDAHHPARRTQRHESFSSQTRSQGHRDSSASHATQVFDPEWACTETTIGSRRNDVINLVLTCIPNTMDLRVIEEFFKHHSRVTRIERAKFYKYSNDSDAPICPAVFV